MRVTKTPLSHSDAIKAGIARRKTAHAKRVRAWKTWGPYTKDLWPWGDGCGCAWCKVKNPKVRYCKRCGLAIPAPSSMGRPLKTCGRAAFRMDAKRRRDGIPTFDEYDAARAKVTDAAWMLLPRAERKEREARREANWREQELRRRARAKAERAAKAEARLAKAAAKKAKSFRNTPVVFTPEPLRLAAPRTGRG